MENEFQNGTHLGKKRAILDLIFTFSSHQGKTQKILRHISHLCTNTHLAHPIDFCALPILLKLRIYHFFGVTPVVNSYMHHLGGIDVSNKMNKISSHL